MAQLKEHHKTVVRGTFWGIAGTAALKLVSFVYTILVARLFLQDDVGLFYLGISIMYTLATFGDLGLTAAFSRYVPYYIGKNQKNKVVALLDYSYRYAGVLSLLTGIALFLLSNNIAAFFQSPGLALPLQAMAVFLLFSSIFGLNAAFLGSLKLVKENNFLQNLQNALKLGLLILFYFWLGAGMWALVASFVLSYIIATLVSFVYVQLAIKKAGLDKVSGKKENGLVLMKEVVPFGMTLAAVAAFWSIANYLDRMMLGALLDPKISAGAIAVYSIALALATIITIFPSSVVGIFLPLVSELHGKEAKEESADISNVSIRWSIFLTVPVTVMLMAFPAEILQMFFGSTYAVGATMLWIISLGTFVRSLSYVHGMILSAKKIVKIEAIAVLIAIAINLVLGYVLIPVWGIEGAAIATSIAFLAVSIMIVHYCKQIAGFGFPGRLVRPLIAGVLSLALLLILRGPVLEILQQIPTFGFTGSDLLGLAIQKLLKLFGLGILFLFSTMAFFIFLVLTKSFEEEDSELAAALMRKIRMPAQTIELVQRLMGVKDV
jgi:O-antigen/teichoic acid export membrane protein